MLTEFIIKKLKTAKYKLLKDKTFFAEIPGLKGVWANARNLEDCRRELREVLEEWVLLRIRDRQRVPGLYLNVDRRQIAKHA